jgi:hypothetical protein
MDSVKRVNFIIKCLIWVFVVLSGILGVYLERQTRFIGDFISIMFSSVL